jgi:hypothetical protein
MRLLKPSAGLLLMGEESRVKIRSRMPGRGPCSDHSQNKKFNLIYLHIDVTVATRASEQKSASCRVVSEFVPGDPIFTGFFHAPVEPGESEGGGTIGRLGP